MRPNKNALRQHFIAPFTAAGVEPTETDFLELADFITEINDASEENTEDVAYFSGDGTAIPEVRGIRGAYEVVGFYNSSNPAQRLIADMKYKTGTDRLVWHKVISADGTREWTGEATVTEIVAGSGPAEEYEEFSCTISFNQIPEKRSLA